MHRHTHTCIDVAVGTPKSDVPAVAVCGSMAAAWAGTVSSSWRHRRGRNRLSFAADRIGSRLHWRCSRRSAFDRTVHHRPIHARKLRARNIVVLICLIIARQDWCGHCRIRTRQRTLSGWTQINKSGFCGGCVENNIMFAFVIGVHNRGHVRSRSVSKGEELFQAAACAMPSLGRVISDSYPPTHRT